MGVVWVSDGAAVDGLPVPGLAGLRCAPDALVAVAEAGPVRAAVLGRCSVSKDAVRAAALAAVRSGRWSEVTRWPGSYWVVVDDGRRRFVTGDLAGCRAVFWAPTSTGFVWSSQAARVAAAVGGRPDLALLAARTVAGAEHWPTQSVYCGVRQVPGGFGLLTTGERGELVDVAALPAPRSMEEAAPAVADALDAAVAAAIGDAEEVSADLSGGLDSSTVVMTAVRSVPVRAATYAGPLASVEDTAFARRVAAATGVAHHVCEGDESTWSFAVEPPVATDGPSLAAANAGMDAAYLRPVAGAAVHLTGHGGDVVLESSSAAFTDLLQRGRRREAHTAVVAYARAIDQAPGPMWRQVKEGSAGRREALRAAAERVAAGLPEPGSNVWSWCRIGGASAWLTADGRAVVADLLRASAAGNGDGLAGEWDDWAALRMGGAVARDEEPLLDVLGVRPAHPFLDNVMVRACFTVPAAERRRTGLYKPLLAAARPDLPAWLTGRCSKGSFGPVLLSGLRANRSRLQALLEASPLVNALFDVSAVVGALRTAAAGDARAPLPALHQLLSSSQWLEGLSAMAVPPAAAGSAAC
ncbi:asparagine synthase-related protein [Actinacidiphila sp. bgisy145]|uniref:asparagine synthase-related protein n=1 Tax=Actinacidiphila sp. bgisy145 TaxID=3413792 RepID=UPI003EBBA771